METKHYMLLRNTIVEEIVNTSSYDNDNCALIINFCFRTWEFQGLHNLNEIALQRISVSIHIVQSLIELNLKI